MPTSHIHKIARCRQYKMFTVLRMYRYQGNVSLCIKVQESGEYDNNMEKSYATDKPTAW